MFVSGWHNRIRGFEWLCFFLNWESSRWGRFNFTRKQYLWGELPEFLVVAAEMVRLVRNYMRFLGGRWSWKWKKIMRSLFSASHGLLISVWYYHFFLIVLMTHIFITFIVSLVCKHEKMEFISLSQLLLSPLFSLWIAMTMWNTSK